MHPAGLDRGDEDRLRHSSLRGQLFGTVDGRRDGGGREHASRDQPRRNPSLSAGQEQRDRGNQESPDKMLLGTHRQAEGSESACDSQSAGAFSPKCF